MMGVRVLQYVNGVKSTRNFRVVTPRGARLKGRAYHGVIKRPHPRKITETHRNFSVKTAWAG